ncbi:MAG: enoyl-CoA hydratase, partial [Mycobacterium sp.]|nr:enoyl-CoA hydratase [Mycobacterium sp.]
MTATLVLSDDAGPVRVLTMNRPAARNALSPELIGTLYVALRDADDDPSVRVVVLTGADPAFCAGVDLKEAARLGSVYFEQFKTQSCI